MMHEMVEISSVLLWRIQQCLKHQDNANIKLARECGRILAENTTVEKEYGELRDAVAANELQHPRTTGHDPE